MRLSPESIHAPTSECSSALETTVVLGLLYLIGKLDEPLIGGLTVFPIERVVRPDLPGPAHGGTCLFLFVSPAELT